jgi:DNA-directed RNA polymerase specialized sigma24 family protein
LEDYRIPKGLTQRMKIPKNMTYDQVIEQINVVVNRIAPKYIFGTYGVDDIKQEAFIICMDALTRYDQKRPLENFLSVHLSNRLKNFVRDNYYTKDEEEKKRVLKPKYLTKEDTICYEHNYENKLEASSLKYIIDKYLPSEYRADYLKMINDVYIPKKKREELVLLIKELLEAHQDEEGQN